VSKASGVAIGSGVCASRWETARQRPWVLQSCQYYPLREYLEIDLLVQPAMLVGRGTNGMRAEVRCRDKVFILEVCKNAPLQKRLCVRSRGGHTVVPLRGSGHRS
jgi:hypothetical protein